jgi:energy-coupling factor transporter transmembrane protein EcfT
MVVICVINFLLRNIYFSAALCFSAILLALLAGKLRAFIKIYWKVILFFGIFWFLFKAAFLEGETVLFRFAGIHITTEGIWKGLGSCLLVLGFSGIFMVFFQLTPMAKLMLALENLGLSHAAAFIFLATFQSILDLSANSRTIMESQKSRGIETDGNLFVRLRAFIPVLGPLVLNAVASTEEKTIAMEARAFSAPGKPTQLRGLPKISRIEFVLFVFCNLALAAVLVWKIASLRIIR